VAVNGCRICLEKQLRIGAPEDEVIRLREALEREQRETQGGFFGASTPASKKPIKKKVE
jgi:transposase